MRTAIGIVLCCYACASASNAGADRSAILAVYDQYQSVFVSRDIALLERVATNDLLHVAASGHVLTLADFENELGSRTVAIESSTSDNREVRLSGDSAVVVGRVHAMGSRDGRPIDNVWRVSFFFVRREGGWRVQATHACVLRDRNEK